MSRQGTLLWQMLLSPIRRFLPLFTGYGDSYVFDVYNALEWHFRFSASVGEPGERGQRPSHGESRLLCNY